MFGGPIEHRPRLCALLDDARIIGLCNEVLGEDFNYASGDGNPHSGDTGWHPDGNWNQLFAVKIVLPRPTRARQRRLRVLPGSHHPDHFCPCTAYRPEQCTGALWRRTARYTGQPSVETQPGDLVIFNHDLYHASFGGSTRRRMFTMNFNPSLFHTRGHGNAAPVCQRPLTRWLQRGYWSRHILLPPCYPRRPPTYAAPASVRRSARRTLSAIRTEVEPRAQNRKQGETSTACSG